MKDLIAAWLASGGAIEFEAEALGLDGINTERPIIRCRKNGHEDTIECDFIGGCDGFHGVSREAIPESALTIYDRIFPFACLGIVSESRPSGDDHPITCAALRWRPARADIARLYVQCAVDRIVLGPHLGRVAHPIEG